MGKLTNKISPNTPPHTLSKPRIQPTLQSLLKECGWQSQLKELFTPRFKKLYCCLRVSEVDGTVK
jgi:hypothetical protein